jgi:hypothetical protein
VRERAAAVTIELVDGLANDGLRPSRVLKLAVVVVGGLVVAAAVGGALLVLWLRAYAPLDTNGGGFAPGPTLGAAIEPAFGSGGKEVFFPVYRKDTSFAASFTLHNDGRFSVTVEGLVPARPLAPPWIGPVKLLSTDSVSTIAPVTHTRPFQPLTLSPGDTAVVVARFAQVCPSSRRGAPSATTDSLRLRYRYLRWFTRTETVTLPFAVTLRCVGGPLAQP